MLTIFTSVVGDHIATNVRFTLDCEAHTVSLAVNGKDQGVVFTELVGEIFPAVSCGIPLTQFHRAFAGVLLRGK